MWLGRCVRFLNEQRDCGCLDRLDKVLPLYTAIRKDILWSSNYRFEEVDVTGDLFESFIKFLSLF
jgi:hypothetical protein